MSLQNIQKIEQGGAKSLTFKALTKFCQVLECQPGDLLIYEEELKTANQKNAEFKRNKKSEKPTDNYSLSKVSSCTSLTMATAI